MKNLFKSMMAIAVAAMSFTACSNDLTEDVTPSQEFTVQINAVENLSRTHFGDLNEGKYPTLWDATDKIAASLANSNNKASDVATYVSDDSKTASFKVELNTANATAPYVVYAASPSTAVVSGVHATYKSWNLNIPSSQKPTATSCDPAAQIVVGQSEALETLPSSVDMKFEHLTAYAKINFTNVALGEAKVNSVTITADQYIAGKHYYQVADYDSYTAGQLRKANSGAVKSITITTSELNNVWVALAPVDVSELTFTINTDKGTITKEVTGLNKEFKRGVVATFNVDMTGKTIATPDVYTLVTDLSVLAEGDNVIIASADEDYAISTDNSGDVRNATAITKDGNTIIPTTTVGIFTVHDAGTNLYAFKDASNDNAYLYASSSDNNYLETQATNDANGYWDITIKDATTGAAKVVAQGANTRNVMQYNYNKGNPRFSCYAGTQKDVALYYKSNGGAKIAIDPQIIASDINNVAAAGVTNATANIVVRGIASITATPDGTVVTAASVSGNVLTYTVAANSGEAREGSITISGGGASATITVSQLGAVAGATVYTLTNKEICDWLTANGSGSNNYVDASISSVSGTWTANMCGNKSNTFLQIRKEKKSFAKTPVFDKPIKSITFKLNSKQTAGKYIYVIPANTELITAAYTTSNILATNYGSAKTAAGEQTIVIELTDKTQNQVMIVASGSTIYINEISVTCAE